jgi:predicted nucleic acid-binding protein
MTVHLLDTDAVIDVLKGFPSSAAFVRGLVVDGHTLARCNVVTGEVWAGLHPHERAAGEQFLALLVYLPTSEQSARQAGEWRYAYARQGIAISLMDAFVAATAREHHAAVVTANTRHFPMSDVTVVPLPRRAGRT